MTMMIKEAKRSLRDTLMILRLFPGSSDKQCKASGYHLLVFLVLTVIFSCVILGTTAGYDYVFVFVFSIFYLADTCPRRAKTRAMGQFVSKSYSPFDKGRLVSSYCLRFIDRNID